MEDKNMSDVDIRELVDCATADAKEIEDKIIMFYQKYHGTKYVQFNFDAFVFTGMEFVVMRSTKSASTALSMVIETLKHSKNDKDDEKS